MFLSSSIDHSNPGLCIQLKFSPGQLVQVVPGNRIIPKF